MEYKLSCQYPIIGDILQDSGNPQGLVSDPHIDQDESAQFKCATFSKKNGSLTVAVRHTKYDIMSK
jgi:phage-related protein